jgi:hypothetical protein
VATDRKVETTSLVNEATARFLAPREPSELLSSVTSLRDSLPPRFNDLCRAFEQNVSAVAATVGVPITLASAASEGSHWQRIHSAERIRALKLVAEPGEGDAALAQRRTSHAATAATERMREFVESKDGQHTLAADACRFLLEGLRSSNLGEAADELLRQGVVLAWSALEILSRDLFEGILNANPKRALSVIQSPAAKQRLQSKFTLEELASAGFDLSSSLGSLLSTQQDFSDIRTIKAVMLPALNAEPDVETALGDRVLWILCQQRHLIVHRRGVVDGRYLESTGETRKIGERLVVTPDDLDQQLDKVVNAGRALLLAASKHAV